MLAKIEKQSNGYVVTYERLLNHPLKEVWEMLKIMTNYHYGLKNFVLFNFVKEVI